jgi:hypothetical protein
LHAETGDKVRLKAGVRSGERGVIERIDGGVYVVRLDQSQGTVRVSPEDVTNYSLAARKAWVTEPRRAVGRRKGTKLNDRVSVNLRIDRDLWERFVALEGDGVIEARTAVVNRWFREKLAELESQEQQS